MPATSTPKPKPELTAVEPAPAAAPVEVTTYQGLADALAAFQRSLPSIRKGQVADVRGREGRASYSYSYADLTDVSEAVLPALGAVGLVWITSLDTVENNMVLRWELTHGATGETRTGTLPIGRAGADWQSLGSAITYARRYALTAATGVAPGGDDDDAKSSSTAGARPAPSPAVQKPVAPRPVEYLPAGIYDLSGITTKDEAEAMFYTARGAGHLNLMIQVAGEDRPFGAWLQETGRSLDEDPDAAAVAAHEAAMALADQPADETPF